MTVYPLPEHSILILFLSLHVAALKIFVPPTATAGQVATATWSQESPFNLASFTLIPVSGEGSSATGHGKPVPVDSHSASSGEVSFLFDAEG